MSRAWQQVATQRVAANRIHIHVRYMQHHPYNEKHTYLFSRRQLLAHALQKGGKRSSRAHVPRGALLQPRLQHVEASLPLDSVLGGEGKGQQRQRHSRRDCLGGVRGCHAEEKSKGTTYRYTVVVKSQHLPAGRF